MAKQDDSNCRHGPGDCDVNLLRQEPELPALSEQVLAIWWRSRLERVASVFGVRSGSVWL
jgi:hypothetical protein